jgi:S-adenosylmethionine:tRNA ribosyltransferase-isomerase
MAVGDVVTLLDHSARDNTSLHLVARQPHGIWIARPESREDAHQALERIGRIPLPHYIRGGRMIGSDRANYQTVYARNPGSAAAPTAGLHFTPDLLADLEKKGVEVRWVTLHIGVDTFRPITARSLSQHTMHTEWAELPQESASAIRTARSAGHRVVAVGTSTLRVLESVAARGPMEAWKGTTDLFVRPPFEFRAVDALMTNFHLPRSTLLVLVRTFGGNRLIRQAYETAVREQYRFYSYGDAMLIL